MRKRKLYSFVGIILLAVLMPYFLSSLPHINNEETKEVHIFNQNAVVKDITFKENKKNVYLFYGSTCPYCKNELAFLEEIYPQYQDIFDLYALEVWNNTENRELLEKVESYLNQSVRGVPVLLIGENMIMGYNENMNEEIIKAINEKEETDVIQQIVLKDEE